MSFLFNPLDQGNKDILGVEYESLSLDMVNINTYNNEEMVPMTQLLLLGKFEYGGGPIFKVVLQC